MNHNDKKKLAEDNEIQGMPVVQSHGIQAAGLQAQKRQENEQNKINKGIDTEKTHRQTTAIAYK